MAIVDYATLKKGGFMRQKQKNNFSLRLACVGGALTAENLKKIAEVAEKYGDGYVHLTSRQGVEIPFIKLDDIDDVTADLATGGCKPGVCGPRVRTVTACQGNAVCPSGNINSNDIAVKLNDRYFGRDVRTTASKQKKMMLESREQHRSAGKKIPVFIVVSAKRHVVKKQFLSRMIN